MVRAPLCSHRMLLREDWDSVSHSEFSYTDSLSDHLNGSLAHTQFRKKTRSKNNTPQQAQNQSRFTHDSIVDRWRYKAFPNKSEENDTIHIIVHHLIKFHRNRFIVADTSYCQSGHLDFHNFTPTVCTFHSR